MSKYCLLFRRRTFFWALWTATKTLAINYEISWYKTLRNSRSSKKHKNPIKTANKLNAAAIERHREGKQSQSFYDCRSTFS